MAWYRCNRFCFACVNFFFSLLGDFFSFSCSEIYLRIFYSQNTDSTIGTFTVSNPIRIGQTYFSMCWIYRNVYYRRLPVIKDYIESRLKESSVLFINLVI
ncbi:hypothetical protein GQ43DRAFT_4455 [Delitschia confertaspora ATCC 74209]|uniref:Uncharacterized protein n=1 Tax=Delitschia confertaspora ATCC 74209 TaxID=1513339 RepID=A0A9P4JTH6_9PLEO|nr:hypothetical protein GQ43DRAFT_4455 [Delitschia confertaspora ATCC 74209]